MMGDSLRAVPMERPRSALPSVRALLDALPPEVDRALARDEARAAIAELRDALHRGALTASREALSAEADRRLRARLDALRRPGLRRVINATGVVLHTNLGRAPLPERVIADVAEASRGWAALEYDLDAGARGHRDAVVARWATRVTGADDALAVNNCAAAVLLACTATAQGKAVVVSRGELVEIGGGFRVPEVIEACGARLVEVGTTNRTRLDDYARAVDEHTGAVLKVHRSNFAMQGFTRDVSVAELSSLARSRGVPLLSDLGSGALIDTTRAGLSREPTVADHVAQGADLVMCSGDKLMGGPQAGLIVGSGAWVARCRAHPLARALRPGRLVIAALESTLRLYAEGRALAEVPALAALAAPVAVVEARARALHAAITAGGTPEGVTVTVAESVARVGGGTLPLEEVPSFAVELRGRSPAAVERALRGWARPVIARVAGDAVVIDLRCVSDDEVTVVAEAARAAVTPDRGQLADHGGTEHPSGFTDEESDA